MKKTTVFSNETLARLFRALALLLHAGISLSDSVYLVKEDEDGTEAAALQAIGEAMDCGATLSRAMEESGFFPHHAISMVEVGETTGHLESSLVSLADYYDEEAAMNREVRSALLYPCILFAMILAVIGVLVVKVLPVFDSVYASLGGNLTGIAAGLLSLGNTLRAVMPVILVVSHAAYYTTSIYAITNPYPKAICRLPHDPARRIPPHHLRRPQCLVRVHRTPNLPPSPSS